jgi:predicted secreted protein
MDMELPGMPIPTFSRLRRVVLVMTATFMSTACESRPPVVAPAVQPDLVDVLHTDSATSQKARPGMLLGFDLPGHAGTGYVWQLIGRTPGFLELVGDPIFTATDPDRMGSSGLTRFLVRVKGIGKATIGFEYVRSWESGARAVRTARVEIDSTEGG